MATIHPPYALDPATFAADQRLGIVRERETLAWLRDALPASYAIFHSTHIA